MGPGIRGDEPVEGQHAPARPYIAIVEQWFLCQWPCYISLAKLFRPHAVGHVPSQVACSCSVELCTESNPGKPKNNKSADQNRHLSSRIHNTIKGGLTK